MQIFVRTIDGKVLTLDVDAEEPIDTIKSMIAQKTDIHPGLQRLIFAGKQLEEGYYLSDYNIRSESNLMLVVRLLGGMKLAY
ncbi:ubiquitin-related domain-containing protein [Flagelloscypha sp. PMI_526]|nr:ubiquitin-related domain-containing protein [Flagelloscypha sp. PMI_526]